MKQPLAALALLLLAPASAGAADWLGARLPNGPGQPWAYAVDGRKALPAGIDRVVVQEDFKKAYQQWQDVSCQYLTFDYQGSDTTHGAAQPDGVNVMGVFLESAAEDQEFYDGALGGGVAIAAATPLYYGGTIYECDVGMNAVNYDWGVNGESGRFDLQTAANHETGHCLGLAHTADPRSVMYPTMIPGELRRGLTDVDVANLCAVYPRTGAVGSPCGTTGTCGNALTCVGTGDTAFCTRGCDPAAANACPVGFSCTTPSRIAGEPGSCSFGGAGSIKVGAPCTLLTLHESCGAPEEALCVGYDPVYDHWSEGYCTTDCSSNPCPASSHCYDVPNDSGTLEKRCLKDCTPGGNDCRFDYGCEPVGDGLGRCIPACHSDGECDGLCRSCDGVCIASGGPKEVGDSCSDDSECPPGGACRTDINLGICVVPCGTACTACPQGSSCLAYGDPVELLCFKQCDSPSDCPAGQGCYQEGASSGCKPACRNDDECPVGIACASGSCLRPAGADAGCDLCDDRDGGAPAGPDAASPTGEPAPSGCGCHAGGAAPALAFCLLCVPLLRRRSRCRT